MGDRVYVFTRQGEEEVISCLDAASGKMVWQDEYAATGKVVWRKESNAWPRFYTAMSPLIALKPSNKEYAEVAKYEVAETETWAYPLIAGNRVFVKDRGAFTLNTFVATEPTP